MSLKGYRQLSQEETALINQGKELAEQVGAYVESLKALDSIDQRFLAIGATDLQKGFMSVARSIAKPTTF